MMKFIIQRTPKEAYEIAKSQNMTALYWCYLKKHNISVCEELRNKYEKEYARIIYTSAQQNRIFNSLEKLFERNSIDYLPLKGLVIKDYYEVPALRFSCDLDVLVHFKNFERVKFLLERDGWITDGVLNFHDMHFYKDGYHLELHFNICENMLNIDRVLADIWQYVDAEDGHRLKMTNDFFLFHQIAHAYYHFMHGGCGIKPILDIKVLKERC